jgi:hypothetical protein
MLTLVLTEWSPITAPITDLYVGDVIRYELVGAWMTQTVSTANLAILRKWATEVPVYRMGEEHA